MNRWAYWRCIRHHEVVRATRGLAVAIAAVALGAACGNGERGRVHSSRLAPEMLTIHAVLGELTPPCPSLSADGHPVVGPSEDGGTSGCLILAPPQIDARDLKTVVVQEGASEDHLDIAVRLNAAGTDRYTNLAGRSIGQRLAIVADGKLLAAPRVESPSTEGAFTISGLQRDRAIEIVRRLGGDPSIPKATPESDGIRRATKLCEDYVATVGQGAEVGLVLVRTAGDVTSASRQLLGRTTPPWDSLPADHVVASCGYAFPISSPTSRCRGGEIASRGGSVLIDEEGRVTPDPTADRAGSC
jgi:hypothetical protein